MKNFEDLKALLKEALIFVKAEDQDPEVRRLVLELADELLCREQALRGYLSE